MIRPIRIEGDVAYVPLTQGYEAVIDAADVALVEGWNWFALVQRRKDGSVKCVYAWREAWHEGERRSLRMHRHLMESPDGFQVDHEDGNGLNNRRENLRVATHAQNQRNARARIDNSSGVKGVGWSSARGKWRARIRVDGTRHDLGFFRTKREAADAYADASAKFHKDFGRIA